LKAKNHIVVAAVPASLALAALKNAGTISLSWREIGLGIAITGIAALVPDMDHPDATIPRSSFGTMLGGIMLLLLPAGNPMNDLLVKSYPWFEHVKIPIGDWLPSQVLGILLILGSLLVVFNAHLLEHRGPTHSIAFWSVASIAIGITYLSGNFQHPWVYILCFSWGVLSHTLTDWVTGGDSLSLLWPFEFNEL
jgi:membrane-bound metal-dependent hydrolase YbcI (DUF457 family)